ncbi:hypothetical protein ABMA27_001015 [Loxostege sticticalis]|uniref:Endonuclease/exonuclease/phosphatase domain-containing protein n=1 Tax=Loxostege sticticalis TaxID=481309 RepID=A0ABR3I177_LOXSC
MALKVIQANVEHSAASQDLLLQHLAEWAADVAILSEPYYVPPGRSDWAVDSAGLVAIKFAGGLPFTLHAQGDGYVVVKHGQMLLAGVYCPPNDGIAALEASLNRLSADLQRSTLPALVAGDFNAKSTAWGARLTDRRGEKLLEWATSHGLTILNRGTTPTCVRPQGSSRVDITFAHPVVAARTSGWEVLVEAESLSDHRYIRFDISASGSPSPRPSVRTATSPFPRWRLKALDRDMLKEAALVKAWLPVPSGEVEVDEEAE